MPHVQVQATTASPRQTAADTVVVGLIAGEEIAHDLPGEPLGALRASGEARDSLEHTALTHAEGKRWILVGLGPREELTPERARSASAAATERATDAAARELCWEVPHRVDDRVAAALVEGALLRDYRFGRYSTEQATPRMERLLLSAHHDLAVLARHATTVAQAQNRARDLGNTPANDLTPSGLADYARARAEAIGSLEVTVMDEAAIRAAGMGAFAAVAQGSSAEARLIRLDYTGPGTGPAAPLALVGKAVTFDSGGLSLKPAASMHEMKFDMCGGAAVLEAIAAAAELQLPVRIMGVIGATENLPGGSAIKPGDIVTALDGTTIEINNTDAEGRLVLADCLTYARREGAGFMVDLATLTGGVVVALGSVYAGLFGNDPEWVELIRRSGERAGELAWPLPLHPSYAQMVRGRYAQITNRTERREAACVTAAEFLHHFAGDTPWAHIDIAGTAYDVRRREFADRGATGYGVRLLVELAEAFAAGAELRS